MYYLNKNLYYLNHKLERACYQAYEYDAWLNYI